MPRENYQEKLEQLRADVVAMGELVLDRYETALRAAETGDDDLADEVIGTDHVVNARYLELEEECTELLALQQPVAGDLRLVTASFKIITDLERIGDLATNIAAYGGDDGGIHPAVDFRGLGDAAGDMVADAIAAYEASDPDACREIDVRDDDLDERCRRASEAVVRELLEADRARAAANGTAEPEPDHLADALDDVSRALLAIRDLERVGDHAVNIAARSLFMIESDDELIY
ncbi:MULTISPECIES: phosphate signaling complex protein PhoU [unclassified Halorubrum]|uniref:phosphate signaling complex protein PhoU n=1 Tax=unclassified Halorubrum TaxID=2642239 RepID=UPI000B995D54|nr:MULTISPECIES: phosphate signaling complex protein PhoU [unclassified Halorubrum]OYR42442.1 phosphate transport system regulatory protein PhoU [Halorubrum sp. Eb13]OYR56342.1 phosphate transport system regulatory protein PhoU [Halorubrum sp. Ea1]